MLRTRIRAGPIPALVMSLLFAGLLTLVHSGVRSIGGTAPAFGEPTQTTLRVPYGPRVLRDTSTGKADLHYQHQRVIVPIGTVLNQDVEDHFTAYIYETTHRPPRAPRLAGLFFIYFTLCMALTAYLRSFGQSRLK